MDESYPHIEADIDILAGDTRIQTSLGKHMGLVVKKLLRRRNEDHYKLSNLVPEENEETQRIGKEVFAQFPQLMIQRDPMLAAAKDSLERQARQAERFLPRYITKYAVEAIDGQLGQQTGKDTFCPLEPKAAMGNFATDTGGSWAMTGNARKWMCDMGLFGQAEKMLTREAAQIFVLPYYYCDPENTNPSTADIADYWDSNNECAQRNELPGEKGWEAFWEQCRPHIPKDSMIAQDESFRETTMEVFAVRASRAMRGVSVFCVAAHLRHILDGQTEPMDWHFAAAAGFRREFRGNPLGNIFFTAVKEAVRR